MITQEQLKELLTYDETTGVFKWRYTRGGVRGGVEAGSGAGNGYIYIRIFKTSYLAHRLAWLYIFGKWPAFQIDHKNGVRGDNRIDNLRDRHPSINSINRKTRRGTLSGMTGVSWDDSKKRWIATVQRQGKITRLGSFKDLEDAKKARRKYNEFEELT